MRTENPPPTAGARPNCGQPHSGAYGVFGIYPRRVPWRGSGSPHAFLFSHISPHHAPHDALHNSLYDSPHFSPHISSRPLLILPHGQPVIRAGSPPSGPAPCGAGRTGSYVSPGAGSERRESTRGERHGSTSAGFERGSSSHARPFRCTGSPAAPSALSHGSQVGETAVLRRCRDWVAAAGQPAAGADDRPVPPDPYATQAPATETPPSG